ncbi:hypothetical protein RFI_19026 [Reticulomyxa filosa]|uniref:Uncharacterized protein n=1 Tax=Reticulomyxa filosa TaxID=46433 RepID=X6MXN9_RETFI|nr:hypothetical protein RFI_19026 [Reticulomyxa filosa]|eukprot:ETO18257.1 hypothetical protein RFI_19026 [Reticulomyxa filosa]
MEIKKKEGHKSCMYKTSKGIREKRIEEEKKTKNGATNNINEMNSDSEKMLSYHDFVITNAIRSKSQFVFENKKLAFSILISHSDKEGSDKEDGNVFNSNILYPAFKNWAPKMEPLATVTNVKRCWFFFFFFEKKIIIFIF